MALGRILASVGVLLVWGGMGWTQTYKLAEAVKAGECFHVHEEMKLSGEIRINQDGKSTPLPLTATATHDFSEKVLQLDDFGLPGKTVRAYATAKAVINAGSDHSQRALRKSHSLVVVQRGREQLLVYNPTGALTFSEVELTAEHFDTLAITGLLPGKEVNVGGSWEVPPAVVQALCHFEGLTEHKLSCKLEEVKDQIAQISVAGWANGIELGAQVKLKIQARYRFDLKSRRLTWLEWKQTDERGQGPASPASNVQLTSVVARAFTEQPESLSPTALVSVPEGKEEPPEQMTRLEYRDPSDRFMMAYDRKWQIVGQTKDHLVMRLMDRGDFTAQATVTPWSTTEKGKHMTPEEFRQEMAKVPGWEMEKELQAAEVPGGEGYWIYRISALGQMSGMAVMQNFYLVVGPGGEQVVLAFTLTPKKAEQLGSRDLSLAAAIEFPTRRVEAKK